MRVTTDIQAKDFSAFSAYVVCRAKSAGWGGRAAGLGLAVLVGAGIGLLWSATGAAMDPSSMMGGALATAVAVILLGRIYQRRLHPLAEGGSILRKKELTISDEGLRETSQHCEALYRWPLVHEVIETPEHLFVLLDRIAGVIIPKRSFASAEECAAFLAALRARSGK